MRALLRGAAALGALIVLAGCTVQFDPLSRPTVTVTAAEPTGASQAGSNPPSAEPSQTPVAASETAQASTPAAAGCVDPTIKLPGFVSPEACQAVEMAPYAAQDFRTPSGNISCQMENGQVWCAAIETQMIADTHNPEGDGICDGYVLNDTARLACHSIPNEEVDGPTVAYGERVGVGEFACTVEDIGVTCWNGLTGHGFFLSKARYASW